MDARKAAAAYPALEARIRALLVEHDPSGLFEAGAPRDEHDREVHAIVSRLRRAADEDDVAAILADVLGGWIDGAAKNRAELCSRMAPHVWEAWRAFTSAAG